uniref:Thyroglobulin n=1 Tax=Mesocestoides corti TaxID=53468 RepID=A0A5K3FWE0_MESCO
MGTNRVSFFCRCPVNFKQELSFFTHIALFSIELVSQS